MKINEKVKLNFNLDSKYVTEEGTKDYEKLYNKPKINNIELIGNKNSDDLFLQEKIKMATEHDIDKIIYGI